MCVQTSILGHSMYPDFPALACLKKYDSPRFTIYYTHNLKWLTKSSASSISSGLSSTTAVGAACDSKNDFDSSSVTLLSLHSSAVISDMLSVEHNEICRCIHLYHQIQLTCSTFFSIGEVGVLRLSIGIQFLQQNHFSLGKWLPCFFHKLFTERKFCISLHIYIWYKLMFYNLYYKL